jgi:hypothetical protein
LQSFKPQENVLKKLLILMLIASAPATAKTWNSCEDSLTLDEGVYSYLSDHSGNLQCEVLFWPIKNPVGLLRCDNQKFSTLEMVSDTEIIFDDVSMYSGKAGEDACGN